MGKSDDVYYPVNTPQNNELLEKYRRQASSEKNVVFGGRLGNYKYYDMDKVIENALEVYGARVKPHQGSG